MFKIFANLMLGLSVALMPLFLFIAPKDWNKTSKIYEYDWNRDSKDFLFLLVCLLLISAMGKVKRTIPIPIILASIYIAILLVFNQHYIYSPNSFLQTMQIAVGWCFFVKYLLCHDKSSFKYVLRGMVLGSTIQAVFAICSYFGFELYLGTIDKLLNTVTTNVVSDGPLNAVGSFGNNNLLASYLCLCIPAYFTLPRGKWLVAIPLIALALTHSFMGLACLIAGAIYHLNYKYEIISKAKIYSLSIVAMVTVPFFNIGFDNGRFEAWRRIVTAPTLREWFIGMGPGGYTDWRLVIPMKDKYVPFLQEHNSYLSVFNTFGLIAFLILAPLFIKFLKHKDKNPRIATTLFIAFWSSWGHFTVQQSTVMIIIIPITAFCIGEIYEINNSTNSSSL